MAKPVSEPSMWRNGNFLKLWLGTVLSALGDGALFVLLSWYVIDVTGSEAILGTTLLCMSVPRLAFMLLGGVVADRVNRKWIMSFSVLARAVVLAIFVLAIRTEEGAPSTIPRYAMALVFGTVDAFFWPARGSILPFIVFKEQLPAANSIMETSQQLSMIGGPLLASLLLQTGSYPAMFAVIAAVFLFGMLIILTLRLLPRDQSETHSATVESASSSYIRTLTDGLRYVWNIRILTIVMVVSMFLNLVFNGPNNLALPVLVKELGWDGGAYSSLGAAMGCGTVIGGLLTGLAKGFRGRYLLLPFFLAVMGCGVAALGWMNQLAFGLGTMFVIGMMLSMTNIPLITYVQSIVHAQMLGRVMSLLTFMSLGLSPVSYALCSMILDRNLASPPALLIIGGILLGTIGLSLILFPEVRRMEDHPEWRKNSAGTKQTAQQSSV
jgi:MFS family permease